MYSEFIGNPQLDYLVPFGALTWFRGTWGDQPFSLLSVKRQSHQDLPEYYRPATLEAVNKGIWTMIAATLWKHSTHLCGDFSLLPDQLDNLLQVKKLDAWRVPFTGTDLSWTHPSDATDSSGLPYTSPLNHLVWNGQDTPECKVAMSPAFSKRHRPIILTTSILGVFEEIPSLSDLEDEDHIDPKLPTHSPLQGYRLHHLGHQICKETRLEAAQ